MDIQNEEITDREYGVLAKALARREILKQEKEDRAKQGLSTLPSFTQVALIAKQGRELREQGTEATNNHLPPGIKALIDSHDNFRRRRRLKYIPPPVIQNQKALHLSDYQKVGMTRVRDFYTVTVRGNNPNESDFHMQARIGFCNQTRRRGGNVRLRPLHEDPEAPKRSNSKMKAEMKSRMTQRRKTALKETDKFFSNPPPTPPDDSPLGKAKLRALHKDAVRRAVRGVLRYAYNRLPSLEAEEATGEEEVDAQEDDDDAADKAAPQASPRDLC